jgi:hypothetical protein
VHRPCSGSCDENDGKGRKMGTKSNETMNKKTNRPSGPRPKMRRDAAEKTSQQTRRTTQTKFRPPKKKYIEHVEKMRRTEQTHTTHPAPHPSPSTGDTRPSSPAPRRTPSYWGAKA